MTEKHTYEFGYAGNSYFNGSDGLVTRDDGKSIRINSHDRCMSVSVKDHGSPTDQLSDETKAKLAELPRDGSLDAWGEEESTIGRLYERVREQWWHDAEWFTTEDTEAPDWATGVHSAGRSGGWCVIEGSEFLADNFPSKTLDFMVKEAGGYKEYAIIRWTTGKIIEEGTTAIEGYDDLDEAEARVEALKEEHGDEFGFEVDENLGRALTQRDEFLEIAFNMVENIDNLKGECLTSMIEEEYDELEDKRSSNIIVSDN